MSTNKTKNYQLHSWAAQDDFLRSEFNDNFTKLDDVVKKGLTGLETGLSRKIEVVIGSYTGTQPSPEYTTRRIDLGFRPKLVLLADTERFTYGGVLATDKALDGAKWVVIDDTGFTIHHGPFSTNLAGRAYLYAAFR